MLCVIQWLTNVNSLHERLIQLKASENIRELSNVHVHVHVHVKCFALTRHQVPSVQTWALSTASNITHGFPLHVNCLLVSVVEMASEALPNYIRAILMRFS